MFSFKKKPEPVLKTRTVKRNLYSIKVEFYFIGKNQETEMYKEKFETCYESETPESLIYDIENEFKTNYSIYLPGNKVRINAGYFDLAKIVLLDVKNIEKEIEEIYYE